MIAETHEPFIECSGLVKIYKVEDIEVVALQGLDLIVEAGEMTAIIGPSGSGKTSLMNVLGGLDAPSAGKTVVDGTDLLKLTERERLEYRRNTVGFVWQAVSRNLVPYLSALENVEMPMILSGRYRRERAKHLLEIVGLKERMSHVPSGMSGGEQQRVAIAVALANEPALLLADEPTGSLDSQTRDRIAEVFDEVRRTLGVTIVIVTHDRDMAKAVDRYVEIRDGKTSREAVRKSDRLLLTAEAAQDQPETGQRPAEDTHEHFVLLDSAGRLQIPPDMLSSHGIKGRVRLHEEAGRIVILPPDADAEANADTNEEQS